MKVVKIKSGMLPAFNSSKRIKKANFSKKNTLLESPFQRAAREETNIFKLTYI